MTSKHLFIFSLIFPFKGSETFVFNEIKILAESFEKITIIPFECKVELEYTLPINVEVRCIERKKNKIRKLIFRNKKLIFKYFIKSLLKTKNSFDHFINIKYAISKLIETLDYANSFQEFLAQNNYENSNNIYYCQWFNESASMIAMLKQRGLDGRFVARLHGFDIDPRQNGRGFFPFRKIELQQFDILCPVSDFGRSLLEDFGLRSSKIIVQRIGVNDNGGVNLVKNKSFENSHLIISCSKIIKLKRLSLLIDILSHLNIDFKWFHFGDGPLREEVQKKAESSLSSDSFKIFGETRHEDVLKFMSNNYVDLFINVSELEGVPVSLMESIASGIPIVGCKICGVPEIVTNQTGLLLPENPEPLSAAAEIEKFLKTYARNEEFRSNVYKNWQTNYCAKKNYTLFMNDVLNG